MRNTKRTHAISPLRGLSAHPLRETAQMACAQSPMLPSAPAAERQPLATQIANRA
ncbi:MAG: hypothetical protein ABSE57_04640 [Bryobacteraceae bacterium]